MAFDNKKQLLIIVGAVFAGIVAVVLTSNYVKSSIETQTAALAEQYDLKQKQVISAIQQRNDQQMASLAQELEHVKVTQAADTKKQIAALKASQEQETKLLLSQQKAALAPKPVRKPSLALKTPVGKRALTIRIDSLAAVGGLLNAGDFVDVIAELKVPADQTGKKTVTAMIFQGLQVLAVNTNEDDPGDYDKQQQLNTLKITVAVEPEEAGLLAFANKNGLLELALRSPSDSEHKMVSASTWKTLADYVLKNQGLNIQDPDGDEAHKQPVELKPAIQIFRGGKEL